MSITYRLATEADAESIVRLFKQDSNPYDWSLDKWQHYYIAYPEGPPQALIAVDEGEVIGHYGLLPVVVGNLPAMLGLHAYVRLDRRGPEVIANLMEHVHGACREAGVALVCGFPNPGFAIFMRRILGWRTVGYMHFVDVAEFEVSSFEERIRFQYSDAWYWWKFGGIQDVYIQTYQRAGEVHHQLLKMRGPGKVEAKELAVDALNCWDPQAYADQPTGTWNQPFSVKLLREGLDSQFLDIENWYIEMGDSDTFEYRMRRPRWSIIK